MTDLSWWLDAKRALVELTALDRDALHIYFAVALYLLTVAVSRRRLTDWRTLVPLLLLELLNEYADLRYEVWPPHDRPLQYWASAHDILNTLAMPALIVLLARAVERRAVSAPPGQLEPEGEQQREQ